MSDLSNSEKRKFERLLDMGSGYVLNFSNRTFEEFFIDNIGRSIYDSRYDYGSGSKTAWLLGYGGKSDCWQGDGRAYRLWY